MLNFANDLAAAIDALRRHAILFLLGVTLIALALLGRSWLDAHDASLRLQATLAAQQKTITDADQRQSTRDAQLTQTLAQITAAKQKVQTPTQAAAALTQSIPQLIAGTSGGRTLPSPITIDLPTEIAPSSTTAAGNSAAEIVKSADDANSSTAENYTSTKSVVTNPGNSKTNSGAAEKYPWTALKLELARLGLGHATQSATYKDKENREGITGSEKGNVPTGNAPGALATQSGGNASTNNSMQSGSSAQTKSPPNSGANARGNSQSAQMNPSSASGAATQAGPPPAIIRVPQEDLKPLYDAVEDCQACQAKLSAAQADLSDEKTKFTAATTERDAAIAAARGTFWKRASTAAKWIAIGAAAGAVLSRYH
jgi:hypothetical protein